MAPLLMAVMALLLCRGSSEAAKVSPAAIKSAAGPPGRSRLTGNMTDPLIPRKPGQPRVGICAWVRNEGPHLKEWVVFHRMLGADHIFIFDDQSNDETHAVLAPFVHDHLVSILRSVDTGRRSQQDSYERCARLARNRRLDWLAFLDVDEFVAPQNTSLSLPEVLARSSQQLCLNPSRHQFGSCGRARKARLEVEAYAHRGAFPLTMEDWLAELRKEHPYLLVERNPMLPEHYPSFSVLPKVLLNLHMWRPGYHSIRIHDVFPPSNKIQIPNTSTLCMKDSGKELRIHHYLRSANDYQRKLQMAARYPSGKKPTWVQFFARDLNLHCDLHFEPYFVPMRARLGLVAMPIPADRCAPCPSPFVMQQSSPTLAAGVSAAATGAGALLASSTPTSV